AFTLTCKVVWDYLQDVTEPFPLPPGVDTGPPGAGGPGDRGGVPTLPPPPVISGVYFHPTAGIGTVIRTPAQHQAGSGAGVSFQNTGYDIQTGDGAPVYAPEDGKIPHAGPPDIPGETAPPDSVAFPFD